MLIDYNIIMIKRNLSDILNKKHMGNESKQNSSDDINVFFYEIFDYWIQKEGVNVIEHIVKLYLEDFLNSIENKLQNRMEEELQKIINNDLLYNKILESIEPNVKNILLKDSQKIIELSSTLLKEELINKIKL